MQELAKVDRVIARRLEGAPHERLLVLDATIGQNAIAQSYVFQQALPLTGTVLTKLDGTARGGVAVAVRRELGLPIKLVGSGEGLEDLSAFDPEAFVSALLAPADG
jgi:fused signal recognition particle receptor